MKISHRDLLLRVFPPPRFLTMPSVGVDVSDHSVKFVELVRTPHGLEVGRFGEQSIPDGIISSGKIENPAALQKVLSSLRKENKLHFVRATLPEESGYLFELSLPIMSDEELTSAIEFRLEENVPLAPDEAVFSYSILRGDLLGSNKKKKEQRVVVSVFPLSVAETYTQLFDSAGLVPLVLETEPQATARSVVPYDDTQTHLVVDFGRKRSGISIVSGGAVRFATTTNAGGDEITDVFRKQFKDKTEKEVLDLKNTQGLHVVQDSEDAAFQSEMDSVLEGLVREIKRHMQYWDGRSEQQKEDDHVSKVVLCGGNANLSGLPEYLSQRIKIPVSRANVWKNAFSLERYVPSGLSFEESLGYAPAIGLALGGAVRMKPR